jgi:hypothetical protein
LRIRSAYGCCCEILEAVVGISVGVSAFGAAGAVAAALSSSLGDLFLALDRFDDGGVSLGIG